MLILWRHVSCPITYMLEVDGFDLKCERREHVEYHISLENDHTANTNWEKAYIMA